MLYVNGQHENLVVSYNHSKGTKENGSDTGNRWSLTLRSRIRAERYREREADEAAALTPPAAGVPKQNKGGSHMSVKEIEAKARELRQLQALIDEAQAEAEAIKDS